MPLVPSQPVCSEGITTRRGMPPREHALADAQVPAALEGGLAAHRSRGGCATGPPQSGRGGGALALASFQSWWW